MQKSKRKKTAVSAKQDAWKSFSQFIRRRDCIRTTGDTESGICITCGKEIPFKQSQAGHFIAGRTNAILFDEDIVSLQCYKCNVCNHGEQLEYYYAMKRLGYTEDEITILRQRKHKDCKLSVDDYECIKNYYDKKTANLMAAFSLGGAYSRKTSSLTSLPHACSSPEPPRLWENQQ